MRIVVLTLLTVLLVSNAYGEEHQDGGWSFFSVLALPKMWLAFIVSLWGLSLLSAGAVRRRLRMVFLGLAFFLWGVSPLLPLGSFAEGMGLHPSPMCMVTRPFQFLALGRGIPLLFVALFAFTAVLTVVGNKLFCGWVCPIGALQELIHALPIPVSMKRVVPFRVSNAIRFGFFILFLLLLFLFTFYIYDYVNPFHFLHWEFDALTVVVIAVVLGASLFIYRPFCYHLCPLGLFTWVLEQVSIIRLRFDKNRCTSCNACMEKSNCPAVPAILDQKRIRPDCHACGRCIELCREGALHFD